MTTVYEQNESKYLGLLRKGFSVKRLAQVMVEDQLDELQNRQCQVDQKTRAFVEKVVAFGAQELGIAAPRVLFFKSEGLQLEKGMETRGSFDREHPDEIWIASDRPWYEQGELALHELSHASDAQGLISEETTYADSERSAHRFMERGRQIGWVRSAMRAVGT